MKIGTFVFATAFALSSSAAFAQVRGEADVTVVPAAPPVVEAPAGPPRVIDPAGVVNADRTTGAAISRPPTPGVAPGARDKARVGGEGTSDRPPWN